MNKSQTHIVSITLFIMGGVSIIFSLWAGENGYDPDIWFTTLLAGIAMIGLGFFVIRGKYKDIKKCPFCAEEMQANAIKCKHCGEWFKEKSFLDAIKKDSEANKVNEINQTSGEPISDMTSKSEETSTKTYPTYRHPFSVLFLSIFTGGIYGLIWFVKTSKEMNRQGATIPTPLIIAPFILVFFLLCANFLPDNILVNILFGLMYLSLSFAYLYFLWRYAWGVAFVTGYRSQLEYFLVLLFLNLIGMAIVQNDFNKSWYIGNKG